MEKPLDDPRYDVKTLRRVAALAARLQSQREGMLTAGEIEQLATEAGIAPAAIREALAQVRTPAAVGAPRYNGGSS
jgi:hypothetical protein